MLRKTNRCNILFNKLTAAGSLTKKKRPRDAAVVRCN